MFRLLAKSVRSTYVPTKNIYNCYLFLLQIFVDGINYQVSTTKNGEFWRLLAPGRYAIHVEAEGYARGSSVEITVSNSRGPPQALIHDFELNRSK